MSKFSDKEPFSRLYPGASSVISKLAVALAVLPLGLFVFSLLGRYFFFAELVGNFRCQILCLLIPSAMAVLGLRRWWLGIVILLAIAWSMVGVVWICFPVNQPAPGKKTLKIMSFNVLGRNSDYEKVIDLIRNTEPDVISVLEYSKNWHHALECLGEQYPYQARQPRWHGFGIAIYSKYPLSDSTVLQLTKDKTDNPFLIANVTFGDQTLRLAAVHALSPTNRYRLDLRNRQFSEVAEFLSKQDVPTVVMGDFNCTPWSPFLSDFLRQTKYRDSRHGFGYQATWHSGCWPLGIPIDHAFVSDHIHVHRRYVGSNAGSDHLPIVFEVSTAE